MKTGAINMVIQKSIIRFIPIETSTARIINPCSAIIAITALLLCLSTSFAALRPNIVFIMCDDLGYGDLKSYNPKSKLPTPNLDALAAEGMLFTNGHSQGAVCTPSRYAFMTGEYAFRNPLGAEILSPPAPLAISANRPTVANVLKRAGYATGFVGKWHIGIGPKGQNLVALFNGEVKPGPLETGFDECFYIAHTPDRMPMAYIENHRVYKLDPSDPYTYLSHLVDPGNIQTGLKNPGLCIYLSEIENNNSHSGSILFDASGKGIPRMGYQKGGRHALYTDEADTDTLTNRALRYIEKHKDSAFFLYFAPNNVHVPRYAEKRFRGKTNCGYRCDAVVELDDAVGRVLAKLKELNLEGNTLVLFSGDNGGVRENGYRDSSNYYEDKIGHEFNVPLRGEKGLLYEGGHRVPFLAKWPGKIAAGSKSDHLVCHVDMLATFAAITGQSLPKGHVYDCVSLLPIFASDGKNPARTDLVVQGFTGNNLASIANDGWKFIAGGSNQLYNLKTDISEKSNVAGSNATTLNKMKAIITAAQSKGAATADWTPDPWPVNASAFHHVSSYGNGSKRQNFCKKVNGSRTIRISQSTGMYAPQTISVIAAHGRVVYHSKTLPSVIRLQDPGVYWVIAKTSKGNMVQKVIVE